MQSIDIYEMIEVMMAQSPFNLHIDDGERVEFVTEIVRHCPPHVLASALRKIVAEHKLSLDYDEVFADDDDSDYDDSMDGDFDSAMASAGYGTDEDYGCYGGDEW